MRTLTHTLLALALACGAAPAEAFSREGMPFRCEGAALSSEVQQDIPISCETLDGVTFSRVPAGQYLFVTDIKITRLLASQVDFRVNIRIWEVNDLGTRIDFITSAGFRANYALAPDGVSESYQMPYLIVRPGEALFTYHNETSGGHAVRISGVLTSTLVGSVDVFRNGFESSLLTLRVDQVEAMA